MRWTVAADGVGTCSCHVAYQPVRTCNCSAAAATAKACIVPMLRNDKLRAESGRVRVLGSRRTLSRDDGVATERLLHVHVLPRRSGVRYHLLDASKGKHELGPIRASICRVKRSSWPVLCVAHTRALNANMD